MGVTANVWVLKKRPEGLPKLEDFEVITEQLPECKEGDIIIEAEYLSVDPYQRYLMHTTEISRTIAGGQVAKVIESKDPCYPVGTWLVHYPGWRSHTLVNAKDFASTRGVGRLPLHTLFPEMGEAPRSTAVGVLGMPGCTAYFGFLEICRPKPGDVVVVGAAAGAVGSVVCQIAKIKGCRVIAFTGSDSKVAWLKKIGVDCVANYKTDDVGEVLKREAPQGVNCYFENVGGAFTSVVLQHMAVFGRIAICGAISIYNDDIDDRVQKSSPYTEATMLWKQLKVEGFLVTRWEKQFPQAVAMLKQWMDQGKLQYRETVTEGFANMPDAFIGMMRGDNIGKAVVKV